MTHKPPSVAGYRLNSLVRAAQAGDREAFGELYLRYAGMVYAIALTGLHVDEADDMVQDVFLLALRKVTSLRDPAVFGAWISTIAKRMVVNVVRQRWALAEPEQEPLVPGVQHELLEAHAALRAIRALPSAYRETLIMRLIDGLTGPEIAKCTGLTSASVRVNLHRGMQLLRERLTRAA